MSAPATASAGITATSGESGTTTDISSSTHLQTPGRADNALEMVTHTSALNNVDNYFYTHFIRFKSFNWRTGQQEGTILSQILVNPFYFHENLSYVMRMYNTWSGGFEVKMELAGTGFNGGKLMMVRFPPNVEPAKYNINQASILSYQFLDVKSQGSAIFYIPDFRNVEYHYTNTMGSGDLSSYSNSAGTFVVMVMLPLETSGSVSASVNVQLSARLADDFCVGQMIPPALQDTPSFIVPDSFGRLNREKQYVPNMPGFEVHNMKISAAKTSSYGVANLRTFVNGDFADPHPDNYLRTQLTKLYGAPQSVSANSFSLSGNSKSPYFDFRFSYAFDVDGFCRAYLWKGVNLLTTTIAVTKIVFADTRIDVTTQHMGNLDFDYVLIEFMHEVYDNPTFADHTFTNTVSNPRGESIIYFTNDVTKPGALSLQSFDNYISSGALQGLQRGVSLVFQVIDSETLDPLTFVRWWPEGYWTAPYTKTETLFDLDSIFFKFHSTFTVHANLSAPTTQMNVSRTNYLVRTRLSGILPPTRA